MTIMSVVWRQALAGVFLALTLTSCVAHDRAAFAGDRDRWPGTVRVLVLGQDDRSTDLPRTSSAYDRVLAELQESMARRGFDVVDERFLGARLNWSEPYAMGGYDIAEMARLANSSDRAADQVDAVVIFHIEALYRELSFATRIQVAVRGRIYDARRGSFLGSFELPSETIPGERGCRSTVCATFAIGDRARDIAASISDVLARRLAHQVDRDRYEDREGLGGRYTVTLRRLDPEEAFQIVAVMTEEFPGYRDHRLIRRGPSMRRYAYETRAPAQKLERWLELLLRDMNLEPGDETALVFRGDSILIERVVGGVALDDERGD